MEASTPDKKISRVMVKFLLAFTACFFIALTSGLFYRSIRTMLGVFLHKEETNGIVASKEYNSVHQAMVYEIRYQWAGKASSTENQSSIPEFSIGDSISVYLNGKNPEVAIPKIESWRWGGILFEFLVWGLSMAFGIFLIKRASRHHE